MNVLNYYTPDMEEFHSGFEFEYFYQDEWHKHNLDGNPIVHHELDEFKDDLMKLAHAICRVKRLDKEDIESQSFVIQHSMWDRESLKRTMIKYVPHPKFDSGAQFEKVINETLVWQIFWNAETGHMIIVKAHNERKRRLTWSQPVDIEEKNPDEYFMEFDEVFKGRIRNISEFKRILRQTGVINNQDIKKS